jgi:hypothetical protein
MPGTAGARYAEGLSVEATRTKGGVPRWINLR